MHWSLATNFFLALVAIVNPLGKIPLWLEASRSESPQARHWLALLVTLTGGAILLAFLIGGEYILRLFGIDLASFRIGGGIVILLIGINMLNGRVMQVDEDDADDDHDPFEAAKSRFGKVMVPLAMPMIAGPGAISTVMIYSTRSQSWLDLAVMTGVLCLVLALVMGVLMTGHRVQAWVGPLPLNVLTRLFGFILTAIAAQLIVEGLGEVFPAWLETGSPIADDVAESRRNGG